MDFVSLFKEYQSTILTEKLSSWYSEIDSIQLGLNMVILFGGLFGLVIYMSNISDASNLFIMMPSIFVTMIVLALILNISIKIKINNKYPKQDIRNKIHNHLYQGSLYELFDKNCSYTMDIIRARKDGLEIETSTHNGIHGYILCNIQDQIDLALDRAKKDNENIILKELAELSD